MYMHVHVSSPFLNIMYMHVHVSSTLCTCMCMYPQHDVRTCMCMYHRHSSTCSVPVVIRGLTTQWPLLKEWQKENLLKNFANMDMLVHACTYVRTIHAGTCMYVLYMLVHACTYYTCDTYMHVIRTCMFYVHACKRDRWVPFLMEKCLGRGLDLLQ